MLFADLISASAVGSGRVPIYCYRQLNPSTMQWMLGLLSKALLTQRSLFKSIYNILKVIFSLNKHLRAMTLFSLLVFSNRETSYFANRTPGRKLGFRSCHLRGRGGGGGRGGWGGTKGRAASARGGWEWSDAKSRGHRQAASIASPSVTWFHTPPVGAMRFFSCVLFPICTQLLVWKWDAITPKQILKESFAFSQMMDMFFTVFSNRWVEGPRLPMWLAVFPSVIESGKSHTRSIWPRALGGHRGWTVAETKSCVCVWF